MNFFNNTNHKMLAISTRLQKSASLCASILLGVGIYAYQENAYADTFSGNVNVNIVQTISIVQTRQVNFGVLLNEVGTCVMDATGNTTGDILSCLGNETTGLFTVTGQSNTSVLLSVTPGTANDITFSPSLPNGTSLALTGAGATSSATVLVAGTLSVGAGALDGVTQIPFTLTANYN